MTIPETADEYIQGYVKSVPGDAEPPTIPELQAFMLDCPLDLLKDFIERINACNDHLNDFTELMRSARSLLSDEEFTEFVDMLYRKQRRWFDPDDAHADFKKAKPGLRHPLTAIIKAWLKRPRAVAPDKRDIGILPKSFSRLRDLSHVGTVGLPAFSESGGLPEINRTMPLTIDLDDDATPPLPTAPITLFDHAVGSGGHAPLEARLCTELLLMLDEDGRRQADNRPVALDPMTLGYLGDLLYPSGFNVARHFDKFVSAMDRLNALEINIPHDGIVQSLHPFAIGGHWTFMRSRKSLVDVSISLPGGSEKGASIHKPTLRGLTNEGVRLYRGYQTLAYVWEKGARNGRVQRDQPSIRRDDGGRMVDARGEIILDYYGKPLEAYIVGNGKPDKRVVFLDAHGKAAPFGHAAREENPSAWRYAKRLNYNNLIDVFHPRGARERASTGHKRKMFHEARKDLDKLEEKGIVVARAVGFDNKGKPTEWKTVPY